jgi:hypothetical protein
MSFIRKRVPPPQIEIGKILSVRIIDLQYPVSSPANSQYPQREQLQFTLETDAGYRFNTWLTYYETPHESSDLGKLCLTLIKTQQQHYTSIHDCLQELKERHRLSVVCTGFRDYNETTYPKFKVVCDHLPEKQTTLTPN